jgi:hypothetical protein
VKSIVKAVTASAVEQPSEECEMSHAPENIGLSLVDHYWRAANYLSAGQIYLLDNPLLTEPPAPEHIKPRLLGHWGTTPGPELRVRPPQPGDQGARADEHPDLKCGNGSVNLRTTSARYGPAHH